MVHEKERSKMSKKRVLLIDGDIIAFRTSAICENRTINVLHKKSNKFHVFQTRTEFKEFLSAKNYDYVPDDYIIEDCQEINPDMNYGYLLSNQIKSITEQLWPDKVEIYLDGGNNFRNDLPLPTKYKSSRSTQLTPLLRRSCKDYLVRKHGAVLIRNCEVDDAVIFKGYKYLSEGHDVIVATNDKDAGAYTGLKLFNFTVDNPEVIEIPSLGKLWVDEKGKVRGLGLSWYCMQMLVGDSVDTFKPTELCKEKYGEKSAYKALKDCESEKEALNIVIKQYKIWYPEPSTYTDWSGKEHKDKNFTFFLNLYHQCVRMKETEEDPLIFSDFCKRFDINLGDYEL